jgi:hypothetical protein
MFGVFLGQLQQTFTDFNNEIIPKALRFDLRLLGDLGVEKAF